VFWTALPLRRVKASVPSRYCVKSNDSTRLQEFAQRSVSTSEYGTEITHVKDGCSIVHSSIFPAKSYENGSELFFLQQGKRLAIFIKFF
jgi:hypothetical protein